MTIQLELQQFEEQRLNHFDASDRRVWSQPYSYYGRRNITEKGHVLLFIGWEQGEKELLKYMMQAKEKNGTFEYDFYLVHR